MTGDFKVTAPGELHPIREVVRLTGVNPVTLRAWERRYGLIEPVRTEGGHRLYSSSDIKTIRDILAWTERGVAVSKVGKLLEQHASEQADPAGAATLAQDGEWDEWAALLRQAVGRFDSVWLSHLYGQAFSTYSVGTVFQHIFMPVWRDLLHDPRFGQTSQWVFLDTFLRARAWQRLHLSGGQGEHKVLLAAACVPCHELELLVAGLLLTSEKFSVDVLSPAQPMDELSYLCDARRPAVLVLHAATPLSHALLRRATKIEAALECPLALAGPGSELAEEGLRGTPIACLGSTAQTMQRRLAGLLSGTLDT